MADLVLYNYFRSSTSYRVRIALHLKGLQFEYKAVHLVNNGGEQYQETYKSINPMSEVPSLVHQGKVISQSVAIIEYLDEVFPTPPLFPKDAYQRAKVRQICENINSGIHPIQNVKVMNKLSQDFSATQEQKDKWLDFWISKGLAGTEKVLEQTAGQFSVGDSISAADLFIVPQVFSAERFKVSLQPFPLISKINKACLEIAAFKNAHPFRQPDTPTELR